jgi:uncharacterized small protein (DUF1192 family)
MADIDPDRWRGLVAAYRNSVDSSPPFMLLQEAQGRWARSRADLEDFEARGAVGQRDQRNPDIELSFKRGVAELEQRVAAADAEVKRISALQRQAHERRSALQQLVDGVRAWARQQSPPITLPGDDEISMGGFSASSTHIPTPAGGREFAPSVAPRQGGITAAAEPPAQSMHRGSSGVGRMMSRVWP